MLRRDLLKALLWTAAAAGLAVAIVWSDLVPGLIPIIALLVLAPVAAYAVHRSVRIAGLVMLGMILLAAGGVILFFVALNDMPFRAPGR